MYGIIYTVHVPLCSIHFLISLIDKRSSFPMLYNPTFLYTFVFSISWLLKPAMYAYKYRLAFLSETPLILLPVERPQPYFADGKNDPSH